MLEVAAPVGSAPGSAVRLAQDKPQVARVEDDSLRCPTPIVSRWLAPRHRRALCRAWCGEVCARQLRRTGYRQAARIRQHQIPADEQLPNATWRNVFGGISDRSGVRKRSLTLMAGAGFEPAPSGHETNDNRPNPSLAFRCVSPDRPLGPTGHLLRSAASPPFRGVSLANPLAKPLA
jgi:hypothetical protein